MISTVLFTVGWAISIGLLVAVFLTYRDCKKVLGNANKSAFYDDLDARISRLQREIEEKMPEVDRLRADKEAAELDAEAARRQKLEEERHLETLRGEILRIRDEILQLQPERDELRKTREALDRTRHELSEGQKSLSDQMSRLGVAQAEASAAMAGRDEARRELNELEQRLPQLRAEAASAETQARDLKASLERLNAQLDEQRRALSQAEEACGKLEVQRRDVEATLARLESELKRLGAEVEAKREELRLLQAQVEKSKSDKSAREAEAAEAQRRLDQLAKQVTRAESDYAKANEEVAELQKKRDALASSINELERKMAEKERQIGEKQGALAKMDGEVAALASRRDGLEEEIKQCLDRLKGLDQQLVERGVTGAIDAKEAMQDLVRTPRFEWTVGQAGSKTENEKDAIQRVAESLKQARMLFHPRVLAAFHTSLKTSDYNQLTVLAGVSGTGKSALPRAYAQAMGIHFHMVTVQPGWAGPQDLLGFFNYLDHKYKATELLRYLLQFSKFAQADLEDLGSKVLGARQSEVLIVLLDEMNLARVEYYFSEFLSRLESRPSINPEAPEERRRAAIPLETPAMKNAKGGFSVYPDTNILFVGTMNEDESTQTLSEKVVDRANVLRFGSPSLVLEGPSGKRLGGAIQVGRSEAPLSRSAWEKWCNANRLRGTDVEVRLKPFHDGVVGLSQVMEKLGRPFGYRVHEAMRRYILAYESTSEDAVASLGRVAFADQIEQKIMPKLRGLDTQDMSKELRDLEQLVESLQDSDLLLAYRNAKARPTFEWQGVKREVKLST